MPLDNKAKLTPVDLSVLKIHNLNIYNRVDNGMLICLQSTVVICLCSFRDTINLQHDFSKS